MVRAPQQQTGDPIAGLEQLGQLGSHACVAAMTAAAPGLTLDDVRRAYPTWRCCPTVDGCVAQAVLVPSLAIRAATAPGLLHEIEASIDRRREGGTR